MTLPRLPSKMPVLVALAIAYWVFCTGLVAALYGKHGAGQLRWNASLEIALAATVIALLTWIRPLLSQHPASNGFVAVAVTIQTLGLLECYAALIHWLGPGSPIVTMFGFSASRIFRQDPLWVFAFLCIPVMACASGALCGTARWVVSKVSAQ